MLIITFVRHGNTDANNQRILQGQTDTILNELGHRQAELLAKRLENETYDRIYCSDLTRCQQTAQAIQAYHRQTSITYMPGLRERSFGTLSGLPLSHLFAESHRLKVNVSNYIKERGGETENDFAQRAVETYVSIINEAVQEGYTSIMIVTHGGPLRSLCVWWTSAAVGYQYDGDSTKLQRGHHGNTGITRVIVSEGDPSLGKVELFNCSDHLINTTSSFDIPPSV